MSMYITFCAPITLPVVCRKLVLFEFRLLFTVETAEMCLFCSHVILHHGVRHIVWLAHVFQAPA